VLDYKKINMKLSLINFSRHGILTLVVLLSLSTSCKSKKLAQQAAQAKAQQEEALRKQKEDELKKKEMEEKARREEQERKAREAKEAKDKAVPSLTGAQKLDQYFASIANASNASSANASINEALSMFSSDQTPVLIVISEEGGEKDYDKPTTIKAYLNYLKDQKKNVNRISNLVLDNSGKIKEVELVKQK
jgi:hypothetical protein